MRQIAWVCSISKTEVARLKQLLENDDETCLYRFLAGQKSAGRSTVLTPDEENMIVERLLFCPSRGATLGYDSLKYMMARIAKDERLCGFTNNIPNQDTLCAFRPRHRELTFRAQESKERSKLSAENFNHVNTFFDILKDINSCHPGILQNPNRI